MPTTRSLWQVTCFLVALHLVTLSPRNGFAGDGRFTLNFLPLDGSQRQAPLFTFEIVEPVSRGDLSFPALTLASTESGPSLTTYTVALPVLRLGNIALSPRYGDQKFGVDFLAASLSGLKLKPRPMRGLSLTTKQGSNSFTVMLGQLTKPGGDLLESAVPRVLAFTSTLKPGGPLTLAPRVVTRLGGPAARGGADTSVGAGIRAAVSPQLQLLGDIGSTRTADSQWAPFAALGGVGKWTRASLEASVKRADASYTLLGRVPFAAQDQELLAGQVLLLQGLTLSGKVSSERPHAQNEPDAGSVTQSMTVRIDRFRHGSLSLTRDQVTEHSKRTESLKIEWRQTRVGKSVARFVQKREQSLASADVSPIVRKLEVEAKGAPGPGERVVLDWRASIALSEPAPGRSRVNSRLKSRITLTQQIKLTGEAEYDMFGARARAVHARKVRIGGEIGLSPRTSLHLVYSHEPDSARSLSQRLEGRITRLVSF